MIELVVVIVILGILAAFAVPRFVGTEGEAREAALEGMKGSIQEAVSLAHGKALASGNKNVIDHNDISGVDQDVYLVGEGYPAANSSGIERLIDHSGFKSNTMGGAANGVGEMTYYPEGVSYDSACEVTYDSTEASNGTYEVNATTSGC